MSMMDFQAKTAPDASPLRIVSPRRRVAMYAPTPGGGHARYCHELLTAITELDDETSSWLDVSLVTSEDLDPRLRSSRYPINGILPPLIPRAEYRSPVQWASSRVVHYARREQRFLRWLFSDDGCDAVHVQEYTPWLAPRHFSRMRRRGKAVYFTVHNVRPHSYPPGIPPALYDSWNRAAWRRCNALFVHSEGLRDTLSAFLGAAHPPIVVIPHGVWRAPTALDADEGVLHNKNGHLLFFGQLRRNKGLSVLIEAMRTLPQCSLTIAGAPENPAFQQELRAEVDTLPKEQVRLIDRFLDDEEVPGLFRNADLVVLPYTSFTSQSGVLHDAIAYRRPVVASDLGAMGESVRRWRIGSVVPPNDADALACAITSLLQPEAYSEAVSAARRAGEELSWRHAARITAATYREEPRRG